MYLRNKHTINYNEKNKNQGGSKIALKAFYRVESGNFKTYQEAVRF